MHKIVPFDSWWQPIHVIIFQNCLILSHRLSCRLCARAFALTVISYLYTPRYTSVYRVLLSTETTLLKVWWSGYNRYDAIHGFASYSTLAATWIICRICGIASMDHLLNAVCVQLNANKFGIKIAVESTRDGSVCLFCVCNSCRANIDVECKLCLFLALFG